MPVVIASVVVAGCGDDDDPSAATDSSASSTSSVADDATTVATTLVGEALRLGDHDAVRIELASADWLAADDSFVYVKRDSGAVDRIDPSTGAVVASVDAGGSHCQGIGVGFGSVWTCDDSDVVRVDLDAGEVVSRIAAGKLSGQGHLASGFGRVWVLQGDGSTLAGIDPETNAVGDPVPLPVRGTDLAVGENAIWIVSALDDAVLVVDPTDGTVRHHIEGIDAPSVLSIVGDAVWIGGRVAVHRVDRATGAILSTIEGGVGGVGAIAGDGSGVWVRRDAEVRHVDADSGSDTETFTLDLAGPSPGDMVVAFGALWTTASEDAALFRIALE